MEPELVRGRHKCMRVRRGEHGGGHRHREPAAAHRVAHDRWSHEVAFPPARWSRCQNLKSRARAGSTSPRARGKINMQGYACVCIYIYTYVRCDTIGSNGACGHRSRRVPPAPPSPSPARPTGSPMRRPGGLVLTKSAKSAWFSAPDTKFQVQPQGISARA